MAEPMHIKEILPKVMKNIRERCEKNRNKNNNRGFSRTWERRCDKNNAQRPHKGVKKADSIALRNRNRNAVFFFTDPNQKELKNETSATKFD